VSVEGDEETGYRVRGHVAAANRLNKLTLFVARRKGRLVVLDGSTDGPAGLPGLATEVLRRIDAGRLGEARVLLDWAAEEREPRGGSDPLRNAGFESLWTKGANADAPQMRLAAAALLAGAKRTARQAWPMP
jgi:hypothetical protein